MMANFIPHPPEKLGKTAISIWRIDLTHPIPPEPDLSAGLSESEQHQAQRFAFEDDRRRYVLSHIALRAILGDYLDCPPANLRFTAGPYGKPYLLDAPGLHFNLAHSNEIALLAVTYLGDIGVDVEHIRPLDDLDGLAAACFSDQELSVLNNLPHPQKTSAFFTAWTRKEAFIKALGEGLSHPLKDFSVSLHPETPARLLGVAGQPAEAQHWTLHDLSLRPDYAAAFAIRARVDERVLLLENWNFARVYVSNS